ncbi:creatininase family protein [Spiractinospora alimapuensis]|uniref:creatininase family protein n=1 Tax=Spiractinospora alimapuensis TaxID=2820884 RepID=UPI001F16DEE6|nr:creatininase family protein [Spiractinospora alimapuensis]QVQ53506.1 creatininase family protein [Spiractinospora alimapuensis]
MTVSHQHSWRLDDMTTERAGQALRDATVALLPVGATEQHGPNLATGVDWRIAERLASRIAEAVAPIAVVVPPLPFGLSGHHLDFPGTLHVSASTFMAVYKDVITSLRRHGVDRVVFVNGHRGNENVLGVLVGELTYDLGVEAASSFWMTQAADVIAHHRISERWGHGCEIETSLAMALDESLVAETLEPGDHIEDYGAYEDNYRPHALTTARGFASRTRNGVFGDARAATPEIGAEIARTVVDRTAAFVRDLAAREPRTAPADDPTYLPRAEE